MAAVFSLPLNVAPSWKTYIAICITLADNQNSATMYSASTYHNVHISGMFVGYMIRNCEQSRRKSCRWHNVVEKLTAQNLTLPTPVGNNVFQYFPCFSKVGVSICEGLFMLDNNMPLPDLFCNGKNSFPVSWIASQGCRFGHLWGQTGTFLWGSVFFHIIFICARLSNHVLILIYVHVLIHVFIYVIVLDVVSSIRIPSGRLTFSTETQLLWTWRLIGTIATAMLLKYILSIIFLVRVGSGWFRLEDANELISKYYGS